MIGRTRLPNLRSDIAAARRKVSDCRGDILFLLLGTRDDEQIKCLVRALDRLSSFEKFLAAALDEIAGAP